MKKSMVIMTAVLIGILSMGNVQAQAQGDVSDVLDSVDIHGFISQGYLQSDDNNYLANDTEDGTFQFNEFGINFATQLTDELRLGLQLFARDLGDLGNDEIELDWAFADYRWRDWAGLRVGKIKMPVGLYNEFRDIDALRTSILLPQSVYADSLRDVYIALEGVGIYGHIPCDSMGRLSYQVQWGTSNIDDEGGAAKNVERMAMGAIEAKSFDVSDGYVGSLQWHTPLQGLRIGGSLVTVDFKVDAAMTAALGPIPRGTLLTFDAEDLTIYALSAEYAVGDLLVAVEYSRVDIDIEAPDILAGIIPIELSKESEGYYASASYRFTDWFKLGAYYSIYYADVDDRDGDDLEQLGLPDHRAWLKDLALSTRFDINDYWIFKLEGHLMDGTATVSMPENPNDAEEDWFLFAAKLTFTF
ncbi:MAG: porin [Thermodesulfobacteriota bacterium]|nr:porin [Thermodesulfobacteriota bacterium]